MPGKIRQSIRAILGGLRGTSQKLREFIPSTPKTIRTPKAQVKPKSKPRTKIKFRPARGRRRPESDRDRRARLRVEAQKRRIQARIDKGG